MVLRPARCKVHLPCNDEEIPFNEGDLSYTPHGNYHGTSAEDGQRFDYIWFELCENGYPGQLK